MPHLLGTTNFEIQPVDCIVRACWLHKDFDKPNRHWIVTNDNECIADEWDEPRLDLSDDDVEPHVFGVMSDDESSDDDEMSENDADVSESGDAATSGDE